MLLKGIHSPFNETKVVLEGITVGGKTLREHLEVINHREAIVYVEEIVHKEESLSEWQIKNLHPVERGAMLHAIFVGIHPFIDGNGRTARLLLNLELMKEGFPPVIIKVANRIEYYDALDKVHTTKDYNDFIQLVVTEVEDSLNLYLSVIR